MSWTRRRLSALLALAAALAALAAFAGLAAAAAVDPITIPFAEQNGSGQGGTATLTDLGNGTTRVVVTLTNAPAGPQPIHVHRGACATLDRAVRLPLTSLANGQSETVLEMSLTDLLAEPNAINAHKSSQEPAIYVACADITAPVMSAPAPNAAPVIPAQAPNAGAGEMPRTGGGGMAARPAPAPWLAAALGLALAAGAALARRRRAR